MVLDRNFYYNFEAEEYIANWSQEADSIFTASVTMESNGYITLLLEPEWSECNILTQVEIADRCFKVDWSDSEISYVSHKDSTGLRYAFKTYLSLGKHPVKLHFKNQTDEAACIPEVVMIKDYAICREQSIETICHAYPRDIGDFLRSSSSVNLEGTRPGIGTGNTAGRFGFTKGDGALDLAMPVLGIIDKLYLCGHPDYKKPYKWTFSVLPKGIKSAKKYHGSFAPANAGIAKDGIEINHLSSQWSAAFDSEKSFFERKAGDKVDFSCTYSLGSPGLLVESSDPGLSLSMLEYAGNYQRLLIPGKNGINSHSLKSDFLLAGDQTENWILLTGATEFPDIPILLVFTGKPQNIMVHHDKIGVLTGIDFHIPEGNAGTFVATPLGIESPLPWQYFESVPLDELIRRCRFWSRAFLAYPVSCEEHYRIDDENESVEITQIFEYRQMTDSWGTSPLKTAPLPPVISILKGVDGYKFESGVEDFAFPTKYGFLQGAIGRGHSTYRLPFMPRERKFPLKSERDESISKELNEDMVSYFDFHDQFDTQWGAYPYVGSFMEPYALASTMFNFLNNENRSRITNKCAENLQRTFQKELYQYPIIDWGDLMRKTPGPQRVLELYHKSPIEFIPLHHWYHRKEPFSGVEYDICYLNVCLFSKGLIKEGTLQEVADLDIPLIENDWGTGLTFYYMYLCAMVSGDFTPIKENWEQIKSVYKYFEVLHDWACMGTAYSDNGISWVEGANYGLFSSFVNMAEAIDEPDAVERGTYIAAKQLALRIAIFLSSQTYFYKFFNHAPWRISKHFHEEAIPSHAFTNVPELCGDNYRYGGIYNLTTEGLFPEIFEALHKFVPQELEAVTGLALKYYTQEYCREKDEGFLWGKIEEICACLIAAAVNETMDEAVFMNEIKAAEDRGLMIGQWRGIHIYSRLLPESYFKAQLSVWQQNRLHPVWLLHWVNLEILEAVYDDEHKVARIECKLKAGKGLVRFGCRDTLGGALFNGLPLEPCRKRQSKIEFNLEKSGILELQF